MTSPVVESLRWKKFPVLGQGFVCLVDVMGEDSSIVQAARVSYGDGTKQVSGNRELIRYLMRHQHATPFEMAEIKLLVQVPMDCWRQWVRHRTASINEYSTRYSVALEATLSTAPEAWRKQSKANKQGSSGFFDPDTGRTLTEEETTLHSYAREVYERRIKQGVAREQARKDLPLSTYTEAYWKTDLRNLFWFLELRMEANAQYEIREYAKTIGEQIVQPLFPLCWEAFMDYQFGALRLSRLEQDVIQRLSQGGMIPATQEQFLAVQDPAWKDLDHCRERDECYEKFCRLRIIR